MLTICVTLKLYFDKKLISNFKMLKCKNKNDDSKDIEQLYRDRSRTLHSLRNDVFNFNFHLFSVVSQTARPNYLDSIYVF